MFCEYNLDISLHDGIPTQFYHLRNKNFREWEIPPWDLKIFTNKKLGEGSWAEVYLAKWKETYVAAKVMKDTAKKFLYIREFDNMTRLHHPNIVQLFGYVEEPFIIVTEYFQNKDLKCNISSINNNKKKQIVLDILRGLHYMHTRRPTSFIHRDIKLSNVMLTNSKIGKIGDFGLSKIMQDQIFNSRDNLMELLEDDMTNEVGTERYMAPEIKTNKNYDSKVDIYSCGVLMYELFESKIYKELKFNNFPVKTPKNIQTLITLMTLNNSYNRPSAEDCIKFLDN
jgi:serine/threonine protein kinase